MRIGFDLDGVICKMPFGFKQIYLNSRGEKFLAFLQKSKFLQRLYNFIFRKVDQQIKNLIDILKTRGDEIIIITACLEKNNEVIRWLKRKKIYFDKIYFRKSLKESSAEYKKRVIGYACDIYLEDKEEVKRRIGSEKIYLYRNRNPKDLFNFLSIILEKTIFKPTEGC